MKLLKKILLIIFLLVFVVIIIGFVYEHISRAYVKNKYPVQGEMVNIGDHRLCALQEGKGEPTVVFENGLTDGHIVWNKVQNAVSKFTSTLSYDRAGILWSERGNNPKTVDAVTTELHTLLQKTGHKGPYILVGHSIASVFLYEFYGKYPNEVAGLIFVDCQNPDFVKYKNDFPRPNKHADWVFNVKSLSGLVRLFEPYTYIYSNTQKNDKINKITSAYFPVTYVALNEESWRDCDMAYDALKVISQKGSFGSVPIIIITATKNKFSFMPSDEQRKLWHNRYLESQNDYLKLSTDSKHILCDKSFHHIQLDEPELVINSIKELVDKYRKKENMNSEKNK